MEYEMGGNGEFAMVDADSSREGKNTNSTWFGTH